MSSNIVIVQIGNKYLNLTDIKKRMETYNNLKNDGFDHSITIWEYLDLSEPEFKAILSKISQMETII